MKWLIDECLHVSLLNLAHDRGHTADHVTYLGLGSSKDWELVNLAMEKDYTVVTNNRSDFLALYEQESLHAGLVVIVPNIAPVRQRDLFRAVFEHVGSGDLTNSVVEVRYAGKRIECTEYVWPPKK